MEATDNEGNIFTKQNQPTEGQQRESSGSRKTPTKFPCLKFQLAA